MTREKLQLNRKFLVIESPIPFEIYCPEQDDGVKRRQGSWQMTIHDLLTKSHYPLNPIYNLELIYDETLLNENEFVNWYTTDLNLGEALRGIDGQLVTWNYNERLGVSNIFNSVTGRALSLYRVSSLVDFKKFIKLTNQIRINLNSIFYFYAIGDININRFFYKDFKLYEYVYQDGTFNKLNEYDVYDILLLIQSDGQFRFSFKYLDSVGKGQFWNSPLFSSLHFSISGFIEFYM